MALDLTPDELLSTTRAVRKRLDLTRPVPRDVLEECLQLAQQAPTASYSQNWHFMVAPARHVGDYTELTDDEVVELHRFASAGMKALGELYAPQGFNLGWNLGRIAGAGIVDHVHLHVVPRWAGDTNFMPVLADVKVLPEHLVETRERLAKAWPH